MENQNKEKINNMLTNNSTDSFYYLFAMISTIAIPLVVYFMQ